jgi:hypothetical protein
MRHIWILASSFLVFSPLAFAQHAGGGMGHGVVSAGPAVAAAPHAVAAPRVAAPVRAAAVHGSTGVRVGAPTLVGRSGVTLAPGQTAATQNRSINFMSGITNLPLFPASFGNTPGLGFDFPHLAAVGNGRFHSRFNRFNQGFGLGFSGFLLSPEVLVVESQAGEPPVVVPEENVAANRAGSEGGPNIEDQFLPSATASTVPPDVAEYVFVRRDGTLLFAVAYSWDNGTLRYITKDGVRRSITQDALDMDATQQFNEQRGLNFRLPA